MGLYSQDIMLSALAALDDGQGTVASGAHALSACGFDSYADLITQFGAKRFGSPQNWPTLVAACSAMDRGASPDRALTLLREAGLTLRDVALETLTDAAVVKATTPHARSAQTAYRKAATPRPALVTAQNEAANPPATVPSPVPALPPERVIFAHVIPQQEEIPSAPVTCRASSFRFSCPLSAKEVGRIFTAASAIVIFALFANGCFGAVKAADTPTPTAVTQKGQPKGQPFAIQP